jgi:hypothetical protein
VGAHPTTDVETKNPSGPSRAGVKEFNLKRGNQKLAYPNDVKYAKLRQNDQLHCALENRLHGYIVVNQQLNRQQTGNIGNIFAFLPGSPPCRSPGRIWTWFLPPSATNRITYPRTERQPTRSALTGSDNSPCRQPRAAPAAYSGWPLRKPNIQE